MQVLSSSNVWQLPGTVNTAVETGPGKDGAAMFNPDQRGNRGDSNVTILLLGEPKSLDRGSSGDEVRRKVASLRDAGTE